MNGLLTALAIAMSAGAWLDHLNGIGVQKQHHNVSTVFRIFSMGIKNNRTFVPPNVRNSKKINGTHSFSIPFGWTACYLFGNEYEIECGKCKALQYARASKRQPILRRNTNMLDSVKMVGKLYNAQLKSVWFNRCYYSNAINILCEAIDWNAPIRKQTTSTADRYSSFVFRIVFSFRIWH